LPQPSPSASFQESTAALGCARGLRRSVASLPLLGMRFFSHLCP
jgi:hypothetical protein